MLKFEKKFRPKKSLLQYNLEQFLDWRFTRFRKYSPNTKTNFNYIKPGPDKRVLGIYYSGSTSFTLNEGRGIDNINSKKLLKQSLTSLNTKSEIKNKFYKDKGNMFLRKKPALDFLSREHFFPEKKSFMQFWTLPLLGASFLSFLAVEKPSGLFSFSSEANKPKESLTVREETQLNTNHSRNKNSTFRFLNLLSPESSTPLGTPSPSADPDEAMALRSKPRGKATRLNSNIAPLIKETFSINSLALPKSVQPNMFFDLCDTERRKSPDRGLGSAQFSPKVSASLKAGDSASPRAKGEAKEALTNQGDTLRSNNKEINDLENLCLFYLNLTEEKLLANFNSKQSEKAQIPQVLDLFETNSSQTRQPIEALFLNYLYLQNSFFHWNYYSLYLFNNMGNQSNAENFFQKLNPELFLYKTSYLENLTKNVSVNWKKIPSLSYLNSNKFFDAWFKQLQLNNRQTSIIETDPVNFESGSIVMASPWQSKHRPKRSNAVSFAFAFGDGLGQGEAQALTEPEGRNELGSESSAHTKEKMNGLDIAFSGFNNFENKSLTLNYFTKFLQDFNEHQKSCTNSYKKFKTQFDTIETNAIETEHHKNLKQSFFLSFQNKYKLSAFRFYANRKLSLLAPKTPSEPTLSQTSNWKTVTQYKNKTFQHVITEGKSKAVAKQALRNPQKHKLDKILKQTLFTKIKKDIEIEPLLIHKMRIGNYLNKVPSSKLTNLESKLKRVLYELFLLGYLKNKSSILQNTNSWISPFEFSFAETQAQRKQAQAKQAQRRTTQYSGLGELAKMNAYPFQKVNNRPILLQKQSKEVNNSMTNPEKFVQEINLYSQFQHIFKKLGYTDPQLSSSAKLTGSFNKIEIPENKAQSSLLETLKSSNPTKRKKAGVLENQFNILLMPWLRINEITANIILQKDSELRQIPMKNTAMLYFSGNHALDSAIGEAETEQTQKPSKFQPVDFFKQMSTETHSKRMSSFSEAPSSSPLASKGVGLGLGEAQAQALSEAEAQTEAKQISDNAQIKNSKKLKRKKTLFFRTGFSKTPSRKTEKIFRTYLSVKNAKTVENRNSNYFLFHTLDKYRQSIPIEKKHKLNQSKLKVSGSASQHLKKSSTSVTQNQRKTIFSLLQNLKRRAQFLNNNSFPFSGSLEFNIEKQKIKKKKLFFYQKKFSNKPLEILNLINEKQGAHNGHRKDNKERYLLNTENFLKNLNMFSFLKKADFTDIMTLDQLKVFEKKKNSEKKRRLKKLKLENRRRKKRKRFYPRPTSLRFQLYFNFLQKRYKLNIKNKNLNQLKVSSILNLSNKTVSSLKYRHFSKNIYGQKKTIFKPENGVWNLTSSNLHQKEFYKISNETLTEFERLCWKSYWLRANLRPYIYKIQNSLKRMKNIENTKTSNNLFSGFFEHSLSISFAESRKQSQKVKDPTGIINTDILKNLDLELKSYANQTPISLFPQIANKADYERLLYERLNNEIKNVKSQLTVDGQNQARSYKTGRQQVEKTPFKPFWSFPYAFQNNYLQPNLLGTLEFNNSTITNKGFTNTEFPTLRLLWACNKTQLFTFQPNNVAQNLWATYKKREQTKNNKTRKFLSRLSQNFLGSSPWNSLSVFSQGLGYADSFAESLGSASPRAKQAQETPINQVQLGMGTSELEKENLLKTLPQHSFKTKVNYKNLKNLSTAKTIWVNKKVQTFGGFLLEKNYGPYLRKLKFQLQKQPMSKQESLFGSNQAKFLQEFDKVGPLNDFSKPWFETNMTNFIQKRQFHFWWSLQLPQMTYPFLQGLPMLSAGTCFTIPRPSPSAGLCPDEAMATPSPSVIAKLRPFETMPRMTGNLEHFFFDAPNFLSNSKSSTIQKEQIVQIFWLCSCISHLAIFFALIRIPEIRGLVKFQILVLSKLTSAYFMGLFAIYDLFKKYQEKIRILRESLFKVSSQDTNSSFLGSGTDGESAGLGQGQGFSFAETQAQALTKQTFGPAGASAKLISPRRISKPRPNSKASTFTVYSKNKKLYFIKPEKTFNSSFYTNSNESNYSRWLTSVFSHISGEGPKNVQEKLVSFTKKQSKAKPTQSLTSFVFGVQKNLQKSWIQSTLHWNFTYRLIYRQESLEKSVSALSIRPSLENIEAVSELSPTKSEEILKTRLETRVLGKQSNTLKKSPGPDETIGQGSASLKAGDSASVSATPTAKLKPRPRAKQAPAEDRILALLSLTVLGTSRVCLSAFYLCFNIFYKFLFQIIDLLEGTLLIFYKFLEKPAEVMVDWIAEVFLIEWTSSIYTYIPETFDTAMWTSVTKMSRSTRFFYGLPFGFVTQRFLLESTQLFYSWLFKEDTDLRIRQKKGVIFWDIWSEILVQAAEKYKMNYSSLSTIKEEQELLIENLLEQKPVELSISQLPLVLDSNQSSTISSGQSPSLGFGQGRGQGEAQAQAQAESEAEALTKGSKSQPSEPKPINTEQGPMKQSSGLSLRISGAEKQDFLTEEASLSSLSKLEPLLKFIQNNPSFNHFFEADVLLSVNKKGYIEKNPFTKLPLSLNSNHLKLLKSDIRQSSVRLSAGAGPKAINDTFKQTSLQRWSVSQYLTTQGKDTDLFMDIHPPKSFTHVSFLKSYLPAQEILGSLVCDIYAGLFASKVSKNVLIVGAPGTAKSFFIQALAGETELKMVLDNAHRYAHVNGGVPIGMKLLREVFDSIAVHTPCLFLLEDIHIIGERRPMLISDDETSKTKELAFGAEQEEVHEKNKLIYQLSKHALSHYKKPYKGDFSLAIPTNHFCYDLFLGVLPPRVGGADSKAGRLDLSTLSPLPVRGLANVLNSSGSGDGAQGSSHSNGNRFSGSNKETGAEGTRSSLRISGAEKQGQTLFSSLQISVDQVFAPPATSPFHVLLMKEQKKLKPKKIVKEVPWSSKQGLSYDQSMIVSKNNYSVRVKVALLAEIAMKNLSMKLDMITDLLVIIDSVRSNRGFVVFATTHLPALLDPALRRPGRLDETIALPLLPNIQTRFEIFKTHLSSYSDCMDFLDWSMYSGQRKENENQLSELLTKNILLLVNTKNPTKPSILKKSNSPTIFKDFFNDYPIYSLYQAFQSSIRLSSLWNNPNILKKMFSENSDYFVDDSSSSLPFNFSSVELSAKLKASLSDGAESRSKQSNAFSSADEPMSIFRPNPSKNKKVNPFLLTGKSKKNSLALSYSQAGQFLTEALVLKDHTTYNMKLSGTLDFEEFSKLDRQKFMFQTLYGSSFEIKQNLFKLFAAKISEFFVFHAFSSAITFDEGSFHMGSSKVGYSSTSGFGVPPSPTDSEAIGGAEAKQKQYPNPAGRIDVNNRAKSKNPIEYKMQTNPSASNVSIFPTSINYWRTATAFLESLFQKRYLYNKNSVISKMLFFEDNSILAEPPSPPNSSILMPAMKFENYKRTLSDFIQKPGLSINEKLQLHQKQRFLKLLYNIPTFDSKYNQVFSDSTKPELKTTFSPFTNKEGPTENINSYGSFKDLGYLDLLTLRSSSTYSFYRNCVYHRQRFSFLNQWWNGQLAEHNAETTYLSHIDWRSMFVPSSSGDVFIDFPDAEQYYNPRNRRWFLQSKQWAYWLNFETELRQQINEHFLLECFTQTSALIDSNREIFDYLAYRFLRNHQLHELDLLQVLVRFYKKKDI